MCTSVLVHIELDQMNTQLETMLLSDTERREILQLVKELVERTVLTARQANFNADSPCTEERG